MDAIGANDCVRDSCTAVFEKDDDGTAITVVDILNSPIEMCTFCGDILDEFLEKMCPMYALMTGGIDLTVDQFALVLAFALKVYLHQLLSRLSRKHRKKLKITDHDKSEKGLCVGGP